MTLEYSIKEHILQFKKPAKTSRNIFHQRKIYLITLTNTKTGKNGLGEAAPLSLLSIDDVPNYAEILVEKANLVCQGLPLSAIGLEKYPSIAFGLECALAQLHHPENLYFSSDFTNKNKSIPVNGLVWMNDTTAMYEEALTKINAGFTTIKFKVGALDFDEECKLLEKIRKRYNAFQITLRLDANGAFLPSEAAEQLRSLKRFDIHSIEQPIAANLWDDMASLVSQNIIDIALDEELIGLSPSTQGDKMIKHLKPKYLILKPNLIGGFTAADQWIQLAQKNKIDWWATSALESNIGLNAICQWAATHAPTLPQGLGTGALFENNFDCPLSLKNGQMNFKP